ncbi:MAG: glycosyltransferase [Myxococcales bacterium]|nr:glycosyltransferase [Myxococcales bacterium]
MTLDPERLYQENLAVLNEFRPRLAALLAAWQPRHELRSVPTPDGEAALQVVTPQGANWLSEAERPKEKAAAFLEPRMPGPPDYLPLLLYGARAGYELAEAYRRLRRETGGFWQALYLVEGSPDLFNALLRLHDLRELLAAENVYLFVGPEALREFERFLAADDRKPLPTAVVRLGDAAGAQQTLQSLQRVTAFRIEKTNRLRARVNHYYNGLTLDDWLAAFGKGSGLRALLISNRFSFFVQYANRDIAQACESLGHQALILEERDRVDRFSTTVLLEAIDRFKPHLIHHIDHVRWETPDNYPARVPFVASVLDYLPRLENEAAAERLTEWDYLTGYVSYWPRFGYAPERLIPQAPMTNERIFRPVELTAEQRRRYGCEVSYISNISWPPERYAEESIAEAGRGDPHYKRAAYDLLAALVERYERGEILYLEAEYRALIESLPSAAPLTPAARKRLAVDFLAGAGAAIFRHGPLLALSAAGFDLRLYGRDWDQHPRLAKHARGLAEHGEETNLIFNASAINLHLNQMGNVHNRLIDGYAAGGFFLVHHHPYPGQLRLDDVSFAGPSDIAALVRRWLADPAARAAHAAGQRRIVLENFTYAHQYRRLFEHLRRQFALRKDWLGQLAASETRLREAAVAAPLGRRLAERTLAGFAADALAFDPLAQFDRLAAAPAGDAIKPIASLRLFIAELTKRIIALDRERAAREAARAAAYHASADLLDIRHRLDTPAADPATDGRHRLISHAVYDTRAYAAPFGCAVAPDGRIAFTAFSGDTESVAPGGIFVLDPRTGAVEKWLETNGPLAGTFGGDGALYVHCKGENAVCRVTAAGREPVLATDPAGDTKTLLYAWRIEADRWLLLEHCNQRVAWYDGRGVRQGAVVDRGEFEQLRTPAVEGRYLYFVADGRLIRRDLRGTEPERSYPPPPLGQYNALAVNAGTVFATFVLPIADPRTGRTTVTTLGLASFTPAGNWRSLDFQLPVAPRTHFLGISEFGAERYLSIVSYQDKKVFVFAVD